MAADVVLCFDGHAEMTFSAQPQLLQIALDRKDVVRDIIELSVEQEPPKIM